MMNLKKAFTVGLFLLLPIVVMSQHRYLSVNTYFGFEPNRNLVTYTRYTAGTILHPGCDSANDCPSETPEQLLQSILSSTSYDWEQANYNYEIRSNKDYSIKSDDDSFELLRKLSFTVQDERYAIVKFYINTKEPSNTKALAMKRISNKWKIISPNEVLTKMVMMFSYLSPEALDGIFLNEVLGIRGFDEMVKNVHTKDTLDLATALNTKAQTPYSEEENRRIMSFERNENKNRQHEEVEVPCKIVFPLNLQSLFVYVDDTYGNAKEDEQIQAFLNLVSQNQTGVKPVLRYDFNYQEDLYTLVKYKYKTGEEEIQDVNLFKRESSQSQSWSLVSESSSAPNMILKIFQASDTELIRNINSINPGDTDTVREIAQKVKDYHGNINVSELLEVVSQR